MPKSGSGSPAKRADYHSHYHSNYNSESFRHNDLRDRLNELRKSKDSKERTSSSDRSRPSSSHSSYQEERTRNETSSSTTSSTYYRSKDKESFYKSNSFKTNESTSIKSQNNEKNLAKEVKRYETEKTRKITDAEVNEIVSEEELSEEEFIQENEDLKQKNDQEEQNKNESDRSRQSSKRSFESTENSPKRIRSQTKSTDSQKSTIDDKTPEHSFEKHTDDESIDSGEEEEEEKEGERNDHESRYEKSKKSQDRTRSTSRENKLNEKEYQNGDNTPKSVKEENKTEKIEEKIEIEEKSELTIQQFTPQAPIIYYCATNGCRSVEEFECLNKIEEGAYGVVYRAKDKKTNEQVALKRLKMEKEKDGFPITSLREVDTLLKCQHPNIVNVREIVVGSNMDKIYMVMEFVEHDLKSLMQYGMKNAFLMSEVKCLMLQLLSGIAHLHDNWIIHRDLKTSNLLLSHKGILKIADFGLAREYGSPLKEYTPIVVTLWYRSPELLLNTKKYSTPIDMWSVGCIFGELMLMKALFPGKNEKDQLDKIFKDLGTPTDKIWPEFKDLPLAKKLNFPEFPYNTLRSRFGKYLSDKGFELINKLLTYDPTRRITAEEALKHDFFKESPLPIDPSLFPTWPAKSEGLNRKQIPQDSEPRAPSPGKMYEKMLGDEGFVLQAPVVPTGFQLRI